MDTLVKRPESKGLGAFALTRDSLRPVGELSALTRYLAQDAGEEPCVVFSRRALGSGSRTQLSDLDPSSLPTSPEPEARACYIAICNLLGAEFLISSSQRNQQNPSSSATGGIRQGENTAGRPAKSYTNAESRKRTFGSVQENSDLDPSEPGGSEDNHKGKRRLIEDNEQNTRLYACPFFRAYPYSRNYAIGGSYERCGNEGIKTVRLKEHIRRIHTKPEQCTRCGLRGDRGEIKSHVQRATCTQNQEINTVDKETTLLDHKLTIRKRLTWHEVFSILFPDRQPPPEFAKYFEYKCAPPAARLKQRYTTFVREVRHAIEGLISSEEFNGVFASGNDPISGSPDAIGETAKLAAILSSAPFVPNPNASATQPLMGLGTEFISTAPAIDGVELSHNIDAGVDPASLTHQDNLGPFWAGADIAETQYEAGELEQYLDSPDYHPEIAHTPLSSPALDVFEE